MIRLLSDNKRLVLFALHLKLKGPSCMYIFASLLLKGNSIMNFLQFSDQDVSILMRRLFALITCFDNFY